LRVLSDELGLQQTFKPRSY